MNNKKIPPAVLIVLLKFYAIQGDFLQPDAFNTRNLTRAEIEYCYTCQSPINGACQTGLNEGMSEPCTTTETDDQLGCFLEYFDGNVRRGCVRNLSVADRDRCLEQGTVCKTCIGSNCNQKATFQSCHVCNSETNDFNCVLVNDPLQTVTCTDYMDTCRMFVVNNGRTERGCTQEVQAVNCGPLFETCTDCEGNNCNGEYFPPNRRLCHQCANTSQCSERLTNDSSSFHACIVFSYQQQCYSFVDIESGFMTRGCSTDTSQNRIECTNQGENCVFCNPNTIGCNNQPAFSDPELSCIECNDSVQCPWGHTYSSANQCTQPVRFPLVESCYTHVNPNGHVTRGCTLESELCEDYQNEGCTECFYQGCNNNNIVRQSCLRCRSTLPNQENCVQENQTTFADGCPMPIQDYNIRGCYTRNDNGVIVRGCIMDLTQEDVLRCQSDEYIRCDFCLGDNCNILPPPSNSADGPLTVSISLLLIFNLIIFFIKY